MTCHLVILHKSHMNDIIHSLCIHSLCNLKKILLCAKLWIQLGSHYKNVTWNSSGFYELIHTQGVLISKYWLIPTFSYVNFFKMSFAQDCGNSLMVCSLLCYHTCMSIHLLINKHCTVPFTLLLLT